MWCKYLKVYNGLEFFTWKLITFIAEIKSFTCYTFIRLTYRKVLHLPFLRSTPFTVIKFYSRTSLAIDSTWCMILQIITQLLSSIIYLMKPLKVFRENQKTLNVFFFICAAEFSFLVLLWEEQYLLLDLR